jgi:hypothetical protein
MKSFLSVIAVAVLALGLAGCPKSTPVAGSANTFDSQSYVSLVTADSVIQSTRAALTANQFPANVEPAVRTAVNALIQSYDIANPIYLAYHSAALAGNATAAQQTALTNAVSDVNAKTAAVTSAKGAN